MEIRIKINQIEKWNELKKKAVYEVDLGKLKFKVDLGII